MRMSKTSQQTILEYLQSLQKDAYEQKRDIISALLLVYMPDAVRFIQDNAGEFVQLQLARDNFTYERIGSVDIQLMDAEEVVDIIWEEVAPEFDEIQFIDKETDAWRRFQQRLSETLIDIAKQDEDEPIERPQELLAKYYAFLMRAEAEQEELMDPSRIDLDGDVKELLTAIYDAEMEDESEDESAHAALVEYSIKMHFPEWEQEIKALMQARLAQESSERFAELKKTETDWN